MGLSLMIAFSAFRDWGSFERGFQELLQALQELGLQSQSDQDGPIGARKPVA